MNQKPDIQKEEIIKVWQGQTEQLRLGNNRLRDRLAAAISRDLDVSFLDEAEYFNQKFIEMDQIVELMRHEISGLSLMDNISGKADVLLFRFRQDMERCSIEFQNLEKSFLDYLSSLHD